MLNAKMFAIQLSKMRVEEDVVGCCRDKKFVLSCYIMLYWNRGGVMSTKTCNIFERVQVRTRLL